MTFRILAVCTGNICRSPQVEQLLTASFIRASGKWPLWPIPEVASAGTFAMIGERMPHQASELSKEFGGSPADHAGRQITHELVESADLILALAKEHRSAVARLVPRASRKSFTLREFALICTSALQSQSADVPGRGEVAEWLRYASTHRGMVAVTNLEGLDVVDPFRRSDSTYRTSALQIVDAISEISRALTP